MTWLQTPGGLETPIGLRISTSSGWFFCSTAYRSKCQGGQRTLGLSSNSKTTYQSSGCTVHLSNVQDGRCKKVDHVDIGVYLLESGTYDFGFIWFIRIFFGRFWGIDRRKHVGFPGWRQVIYIYIWCIIKIVIIMTIMTIMVMIIMIRIMIIKIIYNDNINSDYIYIYV